MSPEAEKIYFRLLGERVRRERKRRGWTLAQFEERGISLRHVQFVEAGRPVRMVTALRIAEAFGIDLGKLIAGLAKQAATMSELRAGEREAKFTKRPRGRPKSSRR